jgi:Ser/Thr protein kinase RdoA (MazF antagonist)
MLEQPDIAHYLLSLGLVKPRDVVEEDLTIVDASRRNSVFLAMKRAGPTYVIKQADTETARTLAHEAAILRFLAETTELAGHVPEVVEHEPAMARLVLKTPGGARDWIEHHRAGRFPQIPARILGRVLAALHRLPVDEVEPLPAGFDRMWGTSLVEPRHDLLLDLSAGAQDIVARIQASDALCRRLDELRGAASDGALVHGDLRWENCLAVAAPGSRRMTRLLLVDWEDAGPGTAAFDVGTVLAEYLRSWVASIPIFDPDDPSRLSAGAKHPRHRIQPAIHAFWSAYRLANPKCPTLDRVIELAAVRVLQSAVENAQRLATASARVITQVQLADNMLRRPEDAAMNLLGLRA